MNSNSYHGMENQHYQQRLESESTIHDSRIGFDNSSSSRNHQLSLQMNVHNQNQHPFKSSNSSLSTRIKVSSIYDRVQKNTSSSLCSRHSLFDNKALTTKQPMKRINSTSSVFTPVSMLKDKKPRPTVSTKNLSSMTYPNLPSYSTTIPLVSSTNTEQTSAMTPSPTEYGIPNNNSLSGTAVTSKRKVFFSPDLVETYSKSSSSSASWVVVNHQHQQSSSSTSSTNNNHTVKGHLRSSSSSSYSSCTTSSGGSHVRPKSILKNGNGKKIRHRNRWSLTRRRDSSGDLVSSTKKNMKQKRSWR